MKLMIRFLILLCIGVYSIDVKATTVTETHTNVSCFGGNNGSIDITPAGGIAPYTYNWGGGVVAEDRTNLTAGTYTVVVTDSLGQSASLSINISQPTLINTSESITDVYCGGDSTGAVDLSVSGGTPGYTYLWSNGSITQDISSVPAMNYYYTVTDGNGCTLFDSADVVQPPGMVITWSVTNSSCGGANGAINLTVQYGVPGYTYLWNDGAVTEDRSGISDGTYHVTITDNSGCMKYATITVNQTSGSMTVNGTAQSPTCNNGTNGSITITSVIGSTGPYTFLWSDGPVTQSRVGIGAGTYGVTVTSSVGCSVSTSYTLSNPALVNAVLTPFPVSCNGGNNGVISNSVSGGTSPYSFVWNDGAVTQNRVGLSSGYYYVTVIDNRGCIDTTSTYVAQPILALSATAVPNPLACSGGPTGSVITSVSGGTAPYTYWWGSGITSANRVNVNSGTYIVTVTDANGCSAIAAATIPNYTPISAVVSQVTHNSCYSGNVGAINISVSNGYSPYQFIWSNGKTTEDVDSLAMGTYSVTITDANTCTATLSATINQPNPAITINATISDPSCFGYTNGSISLSVANGNAPYSYLWSNGNTSGVRTNLAGGSYAVTVTDNSSCTATSTLTITEPTPLSVSGSKVDVSCYGGNTGEIHLAVSGSVPPYSYIWNDNGNTQNRVNLSTGAYSATVSDNHNCSATFSATLSQSPDILVSTNSTDAHCNGASDGSISVNVSGGRSPYTYLWNDGSTIANRASLPANTYTLTVTDSLGCLKTISDTVSQPTVITINSSTTQASCNGGSNGTITLSVAGGSPGYSYSWGNGVVTQNRIGLTSGTYSVTVTDTHNCSSSQSINVAESASFIVSASVTDASCGLGNNGSIDISVSGGTPPYNYNWGSGINSQDRASLPPGTYHLSISDASGCASVETYTVSSPSSAQVTGTVTDASCSGVNNGAIDLTVTGGVSPILIRWSNGDTVSNISGLSTGSYNVTVSDANLCQVVQNYQVNAQSNIATTVTTNNPTCGNSTNGAISLFVSGGVSPYNFVWNNGVTTQNRTNLTTGTYSVTVSDTTGCSATASAILTAPATIVVSAVFAPISCFGRSDASVTANVNGGVPPYSYIWSDGSTTNQKANLGPGLYTLTTTDNMSCTMISTYNVVEPPLLTLSLSTVDITCYGQQNGQISASPSGGSGNYTYQWSDVSGSFNVRSNLDTGTYTVTVRDIRNCTVTQSASINQPQQVTVSSTFTNPSCSGNQDGSINLIVSGSGTYSFVWSNGDTTQNIANLGGGSYSVTVSDTQQCSYTHSRTLQTPNPIRSTANVTVPTCSGSSDGKVDALVTGGNYPYTYLWNNGRTDSSLTQIASGNYALVVTDNKQCSDTLVVYVGEPDSLSASVSVTNETCHNSGDGSATAQVIGGTSPYLYIWSNQQQTQNIQGLVHGNYMVTVTDANGCQTLIAAIVENPEPIILSAEVTPTPCVGTNKGSIDLLVTGGTPNYIYSWSNGEITDNITQIGEGNYQVSVSDVNSCSATAAYNVVSQYELQVSVTPPLTIEWAEQATLNVSVNVNHGNTYTWNPRESLDCFTCSNVVASPTTTTDYQVEVVDTNGCKAIAQTVVNVNASHVLFLPNVFTPNNDGVNDYLQLYGDNDAIEFLQFSVFNRWGEKVYETNNHNFSWDGFYKSAEGTTGVYSYFMKVVFNNGESRNDIKGTITLLR